MDKYLRKNTNTKAVLLFSHWFSTWQIDICHIFSSQLFIFQCYHKFFSFHQSFGTVFYKHNVLMKILHMTTLSYIPYITHYQIYITFIFFFPDIFFSFKQAWLYGEFWDNYRFQHTKYPVRLLLNVLRPQHKSYIKDPQIHETFMIQQFRYRRPVTVHVYVYIRLWKWIELFCNDISLTKIPFVFKYPFVANVLKY